MRYSYVKALARRLGFTVNKNDVLHSEQLRRQKLLTFYEISTILDVGANEGQFGLEIRRLGFSGRIVSFEPLNDAFSILLGRANQDKNWTALNYALGEANRKDTIHVSDNSQCSSLVEVLPRYIETAPRSIPIGKQEIEIKTLDSVFRDLVTDDETVLLKLDVQGYERMVLTGAIDSLSGIQGIQVELSLQELYDGEFLYDEAINFLALHGYTLKTISPVHCDFRTGEILQMDGIFFRDKLHGLRQH